MTSWFTDAEREALADFWRIYEGHQASVRQRREDLLARPEYAALPPGVLSSAGSAMERSVSQAFAAALAADWRAYEEQMRGLARGYVDAGVSFDRWVQLTVGFREDMIPRIRAVHAGDPERAERVLAVLQRWLDNALVLLGQGFVEASQATAARQAEALRELEAQRAQLFDSSPVPMWVFDVGSLEFLTVNEAAVRHYGWSREEFARMTLGDVRDPEDVPRLRQDLVTQPRLGLPGRWRHRRRDGTHITVEIVGHALTWQGRDARLVVIHDVTEHEQLAEQLRQSQKMEAVGQLAGGVAHDFNNLLTVILSCGQLALDAVPPGSPVAEDLSEIVRTAQQAASLTRQLLAFSRRQRVLPEPLDLRQLLGESEKMYRRLLGEDIELESRFAADLAAVFVDRGHFEQVVLNLVVNARDAMPGGGHLTLELENARLDESYVRGHIGAKEGDYVVLSVTDTGVGMDDATQLRIFEPFFTTKAVGAGTGLGLSTVFGIVKQAGGDVRVYSAPGHGTTIRIYLPAVSGVRVAERTPPAPQRRGEGETVLLVEDDVAVRAVARRALLAGGYRLVEVATPEEALALASDPERAIDVLVTDVVMPGMNGDVLAAKLVAARPGLPVLFMSGYSGGAMIHQGILSEGAAYLQKPFTPEALLAHVRKALEGG